MPLRVLASLLVAAGLLWALVAWGGVEPKDITDTLMGLTLGQWLSALFVVSVPRTLSLAAVPEAADEQFDDIAPGSWLLDRTMWTDTRHRIRAASVLGRESALLGVQSGTACLSVERSTWRAGEAVTQVRQLFPGDRYELTAEFESGTV